MTDQRQKADAFRALHARGKPLVLFNIWDAGSARVVAEAGAHALATGSWSVAAAAGYPDGEAVPLEHVIANLERITAATDLPVSLDFEAGYGAAAAEVEASTARILAAGAVGVNLEDGLPGGGQRPLGEMCERIGAVRRAAEAARVPLFINARTDGFLQAERAGHDAGLLEAALERAKGYVQGGADGVFLPGLVDETLIAAACQGVSAPVNIMTLPGAPSVARLAELGVSRVSHGPGPWRLAMAALADAARAAHAG